MATILPTTCSNAFSCIKMSILTQESFKFVLTCPIGNISVLVQVKIGIWINVNHDPWHKMASQHINELTTNCQCHLFHGAMSWRRCGFSHIRLLVLILYGHHIITDMAHGHHGIWNYQYLKCLFNSFFRLTSKKTSKIHYRPLCEGNTSGFPHIGPVMQKTFL